MYPTCSIIAEHATDIIVINPNVDKIVTYILNKIKNIALKMSENRHFGYYFLSQSSPHSERNFDTKLLQLEASWFSSPPNTYLIIVLFFFLQKNRLLF